MFKSTIIILGLCLLAGCGNSNTAKEKLPQNENSINPAAQGFNAEASDAKAIAIADSVMKAMGGRTQWDETSIISWNFFGRRIHTWDKNRGKDRIEIPADSMIIQFDIETKEGKVIQNGRQLTQPDSTQKYLEQGYQMWVNDSYWLLMPYKLKDSGATLKYLGMDSTQNGIAAHNLELTFGNVGLTPQNMYHVFVDTADYLVRQWAYFPNAEMDEPQFILPWKDYQKYDQIMLSGNRGSYTISDIKVMDQWPYDE